MSFRRSTRGGVKDLTSETLEGAAMVASAAMRANEPSTRAGWSEIASNT